MNNMDGSYSTWELLVYTDDLNNLGELDGVRHISGYNNAVGNTFVDSDGLTWVVFQDVSRTGFNDYYALRMDD